MEPLHEDVLPYEPRKFPLNDVEYVSMVEDMPDGWVGKLKRRFLKLQIFFNSDLLIRCLLIRKKTLINNILVVVEAELRSVMFQVKRLSAYQKQNNIK